MENNKGEIIIYQLEDGLTHIEVKFEDETIWLSEQQMAELFQTSRTNVVEHIGNIFSEGELNQESTCREFRQVRVEYRKFQAKTLTGVEKNYLDTIKSLEKETKKKKDD